MLKANKSLNTPAFRSQLRSLVIVYYTVFYKQATPTGVSGGLPVRADGHVALAPRCPLVFRACPASAGG